MKSTTIFQWSASTPNMNESGPRPQEYYQEILLLALNIQADYDCVFIRA